MPIADIQTPTSEQETRLSLETGCSSCRRCSQLQTTKQVDGLFSLACMALPLTEQYILIWKFDQAANLHFETRATGILSTHAILPGETSPYGTVVSPGVLAPNHQHLFSLRIDPAIGQLGQGNTVIQEDSIPMAFDPKNPPSNNQYGVGYTVQKTPIVQSGHADANPQTNRIFKVSQIV
jgi:Cu2+-containing amine oxidase